MSKKFKDTRLGKFLKGKGSHIADFVGDVLPSEGLLGVLKNVIDKDNTLPVSYTHLTLPTILLV